MKNMWNSTQEMADIWKYSAAFDRKKSVFRPFSGSRTHLILSLAILLSASHLKAQVKAHDIVGFWMTADDNAKVEIYESQGKYFGKIVWLNPNPKIAEHGHSHGGAVSKPKVGDVLLKDLTFDGDSEWEDGTIFDPYGQEDYSCYVTFNAPGVLKVRGYSGFYFIGRTEYWSRTTR
jgi:uncharacterized protein (DUF2147 family)